MTTKPKPDPKEVRKGCLFIIILIAIPVLCFNLFCGEEHTQSEPQQATYSSEDTLRALTNVIKESVQLYLNENLHDNNSYEPISWSEPIPALAGSYMIRHKYRAKNGFGAYIISDQFFIIDSYGNVTSVSNSD